LVKPK